jgi:integrase
VPKSQRPPLSPRYSNPFQTLLSKTSLIDRSRPRDGELGPTKSGRARRVALSRRLRDALAALFAERGEPGAEELVLAGVDDRKFYHREWRRICGRSGAGRRVLKDPRDSYASWLLTAGIPLPYVRASSDTRASPSGIAARRANSAADVRLIPIAGVRKPRLVRATSGGMSRSRRSRE